MNYNSFVFFFSLLLSINFLFGQSNASLKKDYLWFDKQIGIENTGLFNGLRYEEKYRMTNGTHKFYKSTEFIEGDIVYDLQHYYNIKMKYDLLEDQVIVSLTTNTGDNILKLLNNKLNEFHINSVEFKKLPDSAIANSNEEINGIYETLFNSTNLILYKKNKKIAKKNISKKHVYYTFKREDLYFCFYNNNYYEIQKKKDWFQIFPDQKKGIQSFYNKNKILYQSNFDSFMIQLCSKLSDSFAYKTSLN